VHIGKGYGTALMKEVAKVSGNSIGSCIQYRPKHLRARVHGPTITSGFKVHAASAMICIRLL
jgi:hypothetical protein